MQQVNYTRNAGMPVRGVRSVGQQNRVRRLINFGGNMNNVRAGLFERFSETVCEGCVADVELHALSREGLR